MQRYLGENTARGRVAEEEGEDLHPVDLKPTTFLATPTEQLFSHEKSASVRSCFFTAAQPRRVLCGEGAHDSSCVVEALASDFPGLELLTSQAPSLTNARLAATVARHVGQ